ncbi:MAG TPA: hypothetical protein VK978_00280 [Candidatus Saccharimonadales bacterium]|nr:hypothetical protein [Candidatus Saccharimonadales bacterium]
MNPQNTAPTQPSGASPVPATPLPTPPVAVSQTPPSDPQVSVVAPAVADDGDLIEKEWVAGAKEIVERTRMDPHNQVKEMHAFKADYMKKRYNRTIGSVEE